jgi:glycosyltransferase involved in cell wall biosynthesis
MERRKGIHLCKDIAAQVLSRHDVAFVFAGQDLFGYLKGELLPYLKERPLRGSVHYLGKLDLPHVRSLLRQSDIVLIPSLWENCPYSALEAMAAGRAIVSSDAGGLPELIRDEQSGLVAPTGDVDAFVARVDRLIENRALREALGRSARRLVEDEYRDTTVAELSVRAYLGRGRVPFVALSHA